MEFAALQIGNPFSSVLRGFVKLKRQVFPVVSVVLSIPEERSMVDHISSPAIKHLPSVFKAFQY
jgi:hypothetical protein